MYSFSFVMEQMKIQVQISWVGQSTNIQGSTNCGILQSQIGEQGGSLKNMENLRNTKNMEKMENINQMSQLKHFIYDS